MNQEINNLEVFFLPCVCTHTIEDHTIQYKEEMRFTWNNIVASCTHDKGFFKGMCNCGSYKVMSNLEYLEWLYEKSNKVS
jgi:hypothetical protein